EPGEDDPDTRDLQAFLAGDPIVREALPTRLQPLLLSYASKLDYSRREDIVQQMWLTVVAGGAPFDPRRGGAMTYLKQVMRRAARDVRAASGPPGERTRPRGDEDLRFVAVSVDEIVNDGTEDEMTVAETIVDTTV